MRFIQVSSIVAITLAAMVASAPVPAAGNHVSLHEDIPHHPHSVAVSTSSVTEPPHTAIVKRAGKGGAKPKAGKSGKKSCGRNNSVWQEIKQANRFGDPRETRMSAAAAGIGSLIEWAQGKYKGC